MIQYSLQYPVVSLLRDAMLKTAYYEISKIALVIAKVLHRT